MIRFLTGSTAALAIAFAGSSFSPACQAASPTYSVTLLAPLYGKSATAQAINNAGLIVGSSSFDQYGWQVPTLWTAGIGKSLTGTSPYGSAFAINELGQAAGALYVLSNGLEATYWAKGSPVALGVYGGGADWDTSAALGINDAGQAVGYSRGADFVVRATLWENGNKTALPDIGGTGNWANAINQSGQIAGWGRTSDNTRHAALWEDGKVIDLGTVGGTDSVANGINDFGHVVGYSQTAEDQGFVATRWHDGGVTVLDSLGGRFSSAAAINSFGLTVGVSDLHDGLYGGRAVFWNGTAITDLNQFLDSALIAEGWVLSTALDVNDSGYIVGQAINQNTLETRGFLITPVPEPSTYCLFALGIGFLFARSRTSKRICS